MESNKLKFIKGKYGSRKPVITIMKMEEIGLTAECVKN